MFSFASVDDESLETNALFAGTGSECKSKRKEKKLNGSYIPNLDKIRSAKHVDPDNEADATNEKNTKNSKKSEKKDKKSDDYVLGKLLKSKKKNGGKSHIHTAHDHEKIIENPDPDFTLVELEAERVAQEAVRALKDSRKHCRPAESGVPNLIGTKFGSKLKISESKKPETTQSNNSETANNSSKSLLDRIKLRNQAIHLDQTAKPINEKKKKDEVKINSVNPIERSVDMSKLIKEYFTTVSLVMNKSSTQEIVDYFKDKILKEDGAKFKAILKKLCSFNQQTGFWSLHDEYFNL